MNRLNDEEITLRELLIKFKNLVLEIMNNWLIVIIITALFVGIYFFKALNETTVYNTELRFIVEGGSSGMGNLGELLGSFGVGRGNKTNPLKVIDLAHSKRMIGKVLFSRHEEENMIADMLIQSYDLDKKWSNTAPELEGLRVRHDTMDLFTNNERRIFLDLHKILIGNEIGDSRALLKTSLDNPSGIYSITASTVSEDLSIELVNRLYINLRKFFEDQIMFKKMQTRDLLKMKTDSLKSMIDFKVNQIAQIRDSKRDLIYFTDRVDITSLTTEISGLNGLYLSMMQNFEMSDYFYRNSQPLFILIDKPIRPIAKITPSYMGNIIVGAILGIFLSIGVITLRIMYKLIMRP